MKIGILGTGDVGQALGAGLVALGHEVRLGGREAGNEKARAWAERTGTRATTGTFAEAAEFGELIILATLWRGTENAIGLAGADRFAGKVVIDATNPLTHTPGAPPVLALGHTDSGGEQVQRWLPAARVVKAFNTVGHAHMVKPQFPDGPPDMFICGNDPSAKSAVADLLASLGWPAIDNGGIEGARLLEPLCILLVVYGIRTCGWNHAFRLRLK